MLLLYPIWLWLLLPWAGLVVLTLLGFRPKVAVPFLDLWPRETPGKHKKRGIHPPPFSLVLLILAMLAAIVAMSGPAANSDHPVLTDLVVVVDRGPAMLVGNRLERAADSAAWLIGEVTDDDARIRVVSADGKVDLTTPAGVAKAIIGSGATTLDQSSQFNGTLQAELTHTPGSKTPVLAVTDDPTLPQDGRLLPVRAITGAANVGFVSSAADGRQVMYTLRNDSNDAEVPVQVRVGDHSMTFREQLPPRGETRAYTREAVGWPVRLSLVIRDDFVDDDVSWAFPPHPVARIMVQASGQAAIEKVAAAYAASRGTLELAPVVSITATSTSTSNRSAILAPTAGQVPLKLPPALPDHPILRNLKLPQMAAVTDRPLPPGDWQTLIEQDSQPLLAVDAQRRRVWVGFTSSASSASSEWEQTADFVVFWTNIIDYLSGGAIQVSGPEKLDQTWRRIEGGEEPPPAMNGLRSGLYARGDELRVINVPAPAIYRWEQLGDVRERLLTMAQMRSRRSLSRHAWMAAAVLAAIATIILALPRGSRSAAQHRYQRL